MSFLEIRGLSLRYNGVPALDGVSLDVPRGSRLAVVGASGSGKSTLLRILAGFEAPDAGRVVLDGQAMADGSRIVPAHLRSIGLVAQEGALFPHLTVADNIGFGVPRRQPGRDALVAEMAELVGLDAAILRRRPDALSGGQQQRVALARSLARRPRLMLLDEPFSALDTGLRAETRTAVADLLARAGITAVLVTHDQEEALTFATQVAVLRAGRLLQAGAPRDLYLRPYSEAVARFLGPAVILPARLADGIAHCALGPVPAPGAAAGHGLVMLRPEQLALAPAGGCGIPARIREVDFAGSFSTATLDLADGNTVTLRLPQNMAPAAGSVVALRVLGAGHLLEAAAPD